MSYDDDAKIEISKTNVEVPTYVHSTYVYKYIETRINRSVSKSVRSVS